MQRWLRSCLLVAVLLSAHGESSADEPPFDPAVDVQLFEYAIGPKSFMTVAEADGAAKGQYSIDLLLTFLTNPFTVYNVTEDDGAIDSERTAVVRSMLAGHLNTAYGLSQRLQVGLALPLVFDMRGDGLDPRDAMPLAGGLQVTGIGDLRAEAKTRLWKRGSMRVAGIGGITLPTSTGSGGGDFLGDDLPSLRGRLAWQWTAASGNLTAGANVGVILRKPRMLYASTIGQQLVYGGAAAYNVNDRVSAVAEIFGRGDLGGLDLEASPLEVDGGIRFRISKSMSMLVSGGGGLVRGVGSPAVRASVSMSWAPDYGDTDNDGIANLSDQCPLLAEDIDGFEDGDGCPDDDNDGDLRADRVDQCPNDREDIDGFEDDDGCPDTDNDGDGRPDVEDRCPNGAEDGVGLLNQDGCPASENDGDADGVMDDVDQCPEAAEDEEGFEDWDGCPDPDNDGDSVADEQDMCPVCREDADGFEDEDGCPELDNDRDGLADSEDGCPNEAETINGVDDDDGCPDQGGTRLAWLEGSRLVLGDELQFNRAIRLSRASLRVVDQIALVMHAHPEVTQWLIVAAAPWQRDEETTREQSQRRANVVKAELLMRGVDSDRLVALGAVADDARVAIAVRESASEEAEQVPAMCPADFVVEPRAAPEE